MRKNQIHIGRSYYANVSGRRQVVRIDSVSPYGGWNATNERTGRKIQIRTAGRLHGEAGPKGLRDLLSF